MRIQVFDSVATLPSRYVDALQPSEHVDFFSSLPWYRNLEGTVESIRRRIRIYTVEDGQEILLIVPMRELASRSKVSARRLKSLTNFYSPVYAPTTPAQTSEGFLFALVTLCQFWKKEGWDEIDLEPLDHQTPMFSVLMKALKQTDFAVWSYYRFGNWHLKATGLSADQYLALLPKKLRHTIRRAPAKAQESFRIETRIFSNQAGEISKARRDFLEVYEDSWHNAEPFPEFLPGLIEVAAAAGALRLGLIYFDEEPAAAQLWLVSSKIASIFKVAYKERFAEHSPGTLLTMSMASYALEIDRVDEIDFLSGDDDYKRNWMSHRRERFGLIAHNKHSIKGVKNLTLEHLARLVKRILRKPDKPATLPSRLKSH